MIVSCVIFAYFFYMILYDLSKSTIREERVIDFERIYKNCLKHIMDCADQAPDIFISNL